MRHGDRRIDGDIVPLSFAGQATHAAGTAPLIVLLQGPVGPFFGHLKRAFEAQGCEVLKINFNGGDWLFCRGEATLNFMGSTEAWGEWLDIFIRRCGPDAIVLFGDSRPYHRIAVSIAARTNLPVWCLEEGYARPHFVTCEPGGNNGRSPLRRKIGREPGRTACVPTPARLVTGNLFLGMAVHAATYAVAKALAAPFFLGNACHRNRGLMAEGLLWARNFYRKIVSFHANQSFLQHLIEHLENRYFVVALQVHDDLHLQRNGRGWTMERLVTESIQSFARHADTKHRLVLKVHPMDRGHRSYRTFAARIAALCGCSDRVHVVDDGSIGLMIRHSLGVVTVNSTSGLLALNHGKPLLALGEAIYTLPGLTIGGADDPGALDRFWRVRSFPERRRVKLFMRRMYEESQVNGSFYLREWLASTSELIVTRVRNNVVPLASHQPTGRLSRAAAGQPPDQAEPPATLRPSDA